MSKWNPKGHLISIETRAGHCARYKDGKRLEAYLRSDGFAESFNALGPDLRVRATRALTEAMRACASKSPPIPPSGTGVRMMNWKDPENIRRVERAWARHKSDKGIAQELQIPVKSAKIARWKIVGPIRPLKTPPTTGAAAT